MDIIIKVAREKSIVNFKVFNHTMDRAVTYRELLKKVKNKQYDIILLEEIDDNYIDTIREISSYGRVALVCGRELEYAKQVETASKIGIDIVAQAGELDDYIQKHTGNSIKFKGGKDGNSEYTEVEEYRETQEYDDVDDEKVDVIIEEDDTDEVSETQVDIPIAVDEEDTIVEDIVNYALGNENKPAETTPADLDIEPQHSEKDSLQIELLQDEVEQLKRQCKDLQKDIELDIPHKKSFSYLEDSAFEDFIDIIKPYITKIKEQNRDMLTDRQAGYFWYLINNQYCLKGADVERFNILKKIIY